VVLTTGLRKVLDGGACDNVRPGSKYVSYHIPYRTDCGSFSTSSHDPKRSDNQLPARPPQPDYYSPTGQMIHKQRLGHGGFLSSCRFWVLVPGVPLAGSRLAPSGSPVGPGGRRGWVGAYPPVQSQLPALFRWPPDEGMRMSVLPAVERGGPSTFFGVPLEALRQSLVAGRWVLATPFLDKRVCNTT
jgi:hypothetical protein